MTSRLRDASKPYISPVMRVILGVVLVALLVVAWTNGTRASLSDSITRVALLGAVYGIFVAYSDIAVGIDGDAFVVRNQFLLTQVPMQLVEAVDARFGVYLRIRDRRLAVRVSAATSLFRRRGERVGSVAAELQEQLDQPRVDSGERVRARLKSTWFVTVPLGVALFIAVDLVSRAVH